jgi:siroheme synthase (precorrin-2 oxidase/ferrochelatase)
LKLWQKSTWKKTFVSKQSGSPAPKCTELEHLFEIDSRAFTGGQETTLPVIIFLKCDRALNNQEIIPQLTKTLL